MDDIRPLAKNEKELETLTHAVRIYSQDTGMEFGIEKCAMLVMKSGKQYLTDWREQPNQNKLERSEKRERTNTWASWNHQTSEMKEKIKKENPRRTRKLLETKLSSRQKWEEK